MFLSTLVTTLDRTMLFKTFRIFLVPIVFAVSLIRIETSFAASPTLAPAVTATSSNKIAQSADADLQRRLQEQREAERVLKEGERLKREVRDNDYNNRGLERQVGEQVNKVRESGSNPQKVREADAEITRLRQQNNNRPNYYYDPYYRPYYNTAPIIFAPGFYNYPTTTSPSNTFPEPTPSNPDRVVQNPAPSDPNGSGFGLLVSSGFKDGKIAPGLGVKYKNIGFEIAGIFNQDSLPGAVNDFPLPSNFLFTDLGVKKLSAQWGADVLGFLDVDPRIAVYGSVGLYFQSVGRIAQSQATNDLYKQTNETETTGAIGGGVNYKASDSISVGLGYHSLRGLTARLGISF
jgi:opacity protein-like surface antigen